jgi:hypothetical protein
MLNPSTADETTDDPTIRKCIGFSKRLGVQRLAVVNLFAARATKPRDLGLYADPIGPDNNDWILEEIGKNCGPIIAAWGANGRRHSERVKAVLSMLSGFELSCLGTTKDGHPFHPLMIPYVQPFSPFRFAKGEPAPSPR